MKSSRPDVKDVLKYPHQTMKMRRGYMMSLRLPQSRLTAGLVREWMCYTVRGIVHRYWMHGQRALRRYQRVVVFLS